MSRTRSHLSGGSPLTADHHESDAKIAVCFSITFGSLAFVLRMLSRWPWRQLFDKDDIIAIVAMVLCFTQGALVFSAANHGLGTRDEDANGNGTVAATYVYAADLVFILTVYTDKIAAVATIYYRIINMSNRALRFSTRAMMAACVVCLITSFLVIATQPGAPHAVTMANGHATSMIARWAVYAALSSMLDIVLVAFVVYLIVGLQMPKKLKAKVMACFIPRLLLVAVAALRLRHLASTIRSDSYLFEYADAEIFTQTELAVSLVATTLPCLRPYLLLTKSGGFDLEQVESWGSRSTSSLIKRREPKSAGSARLASSTVRRALADV